MTRRIKLISALIMALLLFLPAIPAAAKKGKPAIKFTETTYNFGTIPEKKGTVTHEFEFVNDGQGNLVILDASAECGCTTPEYPQNPIAPGKSGVVKVTYNPLGRPGSFSKTVTVRTNGNPRKARIKITGVVNPNL